MVFKKGDLPWNKGLTAEIDSRVKQYGEHGAASRKGKPNPKESSTKKRLFTAGKISQLKQYEFKKGNIPWDAGKKRPDISEGQRGSKNHQFGKHPSEETKAIWRVQRKNVPKSAAHRLADSFAIKQKWKDVDWAVKVARSLNVSPNKHETYIDGLLQKHFPGEWIFTGAGKKETDWIRGKCPDWQRANGEKIVIEYNGYTTTAGDRGHTQEKDREKTKEYNEDGWQVINLYPSDIKKEEIFLQTMKRELLKINEKKLHS